MLDPENLRKSAHSIYAVLEKARLQLDCTHSQWADVLELTLPDYARKYLVSRCGELPLFSLLSAVRRLDLSIESVLVKPNSLDFTALKEHVKGNQTYIPERYTSAAFSKKRSFVNSLNYIEKFRGYPTRNVVLRKLQIKEAALFDPDAPISINSMIDMYPHLRACGMQDAQIYHSGLYTMATSKNSPVGKALSKHKKTRDAYEHFFNELTVGIEKNCHYSLSKLEDDYMVVDSISRVDAAEAMKVKHIGSADGCLVRAGVMGGVPALIGNPFVTVVETKCVHRGDSICRFEARFDPNPEQGKVVNFI